MRGVVAWIAIVVLIAPIRFASAQGIFRGSWTVAEAQPAPWVKEPGERSQTRPDPTILNARVLFLPNRLEGPPPIGCRSPRYKVAQGTAEALFEGGLDDPDRGMTDPKGAAAALGFSGQLITSLQPGCDLEFHMADQNTVKFALNNVIYTMHRIAQ